MTVRSFADFLASTPASMVIREYDWIVPAVQCLHILAIAVVMGSALVLDLRLMQVIGRDQSVSIYARRYAPWLLTALLLLLVSGLILIVGEPDRTLLNWVFWTKMALLAVGIGVTILIAAPMAGNSAYWDGTNRVVGATILGASSLMIWTAVIVCGRWIAYML